MTVSVARYVPATICQRATGRSQKYTSVPSSEGSPRAADANTNVTTGAYSESPKALIMLVAASSRLGTSPTPMANPMSTPTSPSNASAARRPLRACVFNVTR